jgi:hypothetical protein
MSFLTDVSRSEEVSQARRAMRVSWEEAWRGVNKKNTRQNQAEQALSWFAAKE